MLQNLNMFFHRADNFAADQDAHVAVKSALWSWCGLGEGGRVCVCVRVCACVCRYVGRWVGR